MKGKEIKSLASEEIKIKLADARKELIKLRAQASTKTSQKNPYIINKTKKAIARMLTELNVRKKAAMQKSFQKPVQKLEQPLAEKKLQSDKTKGESKK